MAGTDGTQAAAPVDPTASSDPWQTILESGVAATGIDPAASLENVDDPAPLSVSQESAPLVSEPEGASAPAPDSAGDVEQTAAAPTDAAPAQDTEPDPLAGANPFSFTLDGETRTVDGTYRIPGEGLVVPEDRVAQFEQVFQRAETADRTIRGLTAQAESWDRLTAWPTKDEQGNPVTLTGQQGYEAQRVLLGRALSALQVVADVFGSDETFSRLAKPVLLEDGTAGIVRDPEALAILKERMDHASYRAEQQVRATLTKAMQAPPPPAPTAAEYAKPTIAALMAEHKLALTQADQDFLANQFPQYVTPDGKAVLPAFIDVMKDRAALRAEHQKASEAANAAKTFNDKMQQGRQKPSTPRTAPRPTAPPATPEKKSKAAQWSDVLANAMQELNPAS